MHCKEINNNKPVSIKVFERIDNGVFRIKCKNCGERFVSHLLTREYCDDCRGRNKHVIISPILIGD